MKTLIKGQVFVTLAKPTLCTFKIEGLPHIEKWHWVRSEDLVECVNQSFCAQDVPEKFQFKKYGLDIMRDFGLLNGSKNGEPIYTYLSSGGKEEVCWYLAEAESTLPEQHTGTFNIPAKWAMEIIRFAKLGFVKVREVGNAQGRSWQEIMAVKADGSEMRCWRVTSLPNSQWRITGVNDKDEEIV